MPMGQGPDREMAEELGPHEVITKACPLPKLSLLEHEGTEVTGRRLSAPSPFKPGCTSEPDCSLPAQVWKEPSSQTLSRGYPLPCRGREDQKGRTRITQSLGVGRGVK